MAYENKKYLAFIRSFGCIFQGECARGECAGSTEPHHYERGGTGTKCSDAHTVPLCSKHHAEFHSHTGWAKELSKEHLRTTFRLASVPFMALWIEKDNANGVTF